MEPECDELVSEARNINYIDEAEYPSTTAIQNECAHVHPSSTSLSAGGRDVADLVRLTVSVRSSGTRACAAARLKPLAQCRAASAVVRLSVRHQLEVRHL